VAWHHGRVTLQCARHAAAALRAAVRAGMPIRLSEVDAW
jgi:hypothetical protein